MSCSHPKQLLWICMLPINMAAFLHLLIQIHLLVLGGFSLLPAAASVTGGNHNNVASMPLSCLPDQASALLRLKESFVVTTNYSIAAFMSWRVGTDCCRWVGVHCGNSDDGRVTSLDLANYGLVSEGLDPVLFNLVSLKYLNLAYNNFNGSQLPSTGFERLVNLTHLNLSSSSFSGQVPTSIGGLTNLISLDLSTSYEFFDLLDDGFLLHRDSNSDYHLMDQNFETLVSNLRNLRELHLGLVDLSNNGGPHWCNVVAVSCPKLRVLSLPRCGLSGPICSSLSRLRSISIIKLEYNHLSGPFPNFFANFSNLTVLQLRLNNLQGWVSPTIFQHKKLVTIDLYRNYEIYGHLPNFSTGSRLENLNVGITSFYGIIPTSLGNLTSLKELGFGPSGFSGKIPSTISNLKSLIALEISGMGIIGPVPSWIANLTSLTTLQFYDCGLSGSIPQFVTKLRYLKKLALCDCSLSGEIPPHITNLTQLQILLLYSNNLEGTTDLKFLRNMPYLNTLDLSDNKLVVLDGEDNSSLTSLPKLNTLVLAGCNISKFPNFLRYQDEVGWLDLSYNQIHGAIPRWAWELWNGIAFLILSNNEFTSVGYDHFLPVQDIIVLDLSNNLFEGSIPIPQGSANALDYSNNMFSSIPANLSSQINDVGLFLAPGNHLSGNLSSSFCGGMSILLLDLSYNNFSGLIPSCLMENVNGMQSLNLRNNKLYGEIPNNNKEAGCSFEALDFSNNQIEGQLPRSLVSCKNLDIFDVGNNQISDSFPCWMSELDRLQVLVLKSNKFFGQVAQPIHELKSACAFPSAKIIDLSSNDFFGLLPEDQWFKNLRSMVFRDSNTSTVMDHQVPGVTRTYRYTTAITYKGHDTTFAQILTTLVFIDFSNNAFNGSIPVAIGELGLLRGLNISHNFLTGPIPSQFGHLDKLEALDLSFNELSGGIPQELASLDFLTVLNLSNNRLAGSIPVSPHFLTFSNSSFQGNGGLCGPPLSKVCNNATKPNAVPSKKKSVDFMLFLFSGAGFGVGFAAAIVVAWGIPVRKLYILRMN